MKIMKRRAYGSIPHLLGSKMGIGDKRITQGQHDFICKKKRRTDEVIVQEKLDGSCVAVYRENDKIYPLTRAGYTADTSRFEQHQYFHRWAIKNSERFLGVINEGERIIGEWILQSHGTIIDLKHEPFVAFDIMNGSKRINFKSFIDRVSGRFISANLLHIGDSVSEDWILKTIDGVSGHGQREIEGVVCRLETGGKVNYLAKYVRHGYGAGKYMRDEIFNPGWENYINPKKL